MPYPRKPRQEMPAKRSLGKIEYSIPEGRASTPEEKERRENRRGSEFAIEQDSHAAAYEHHQTHRHSETGGPAEFEHTLAIKHDVAILAEADLTAPQSRA